MPIPTHPVHTKALTDAERARMYQVLALLPESPYAAVSASKIAEHLGLTTRIVRRIVQALRAEPDTPPILANDDGYYTSHDLDDIRRHITSLELRAYEILKAADSERAKYNKLLGGQLF